MTRIIVQSQVGADGILRLAVPVGPDEANHAVQVTIEHLDVRDSLDVSARLDELKSLQAGWMDGEGQALSLESLNWLKRAFEKFYGSDLSPPHIYPTLAGGVRAEWSIKPHEISLDIDLHARTAQWHVLNLTNDEVDACELNLVEEGDWKLLAAKLHELAKGSP